MCNSKVNYSYLHKYEIYLLKWPSIVLPHTSNLVNFMAFASFCLSNAPHRQIHISN